MGLTELAGDIGGAIADGASSIASAPAKAMGFAKGIADKAEGFVEQKVGPAGMKALEFAGSLIQGPFGVVPSVVGSLAEGLSDPVGFVEGMVHRAESMGESALSFAETTVGTVVQASLSRLNLLVEGGLSAVKLLARGSAAIIGMAAKGLMAGFLTNLKVMKSLALAGLNFSGQMTKAAVEVQARLIIMQLRTYKVVLQTMAQLAANKVTNLIQNTMAHARQRAIKISQSVMAKAGFIVGSVMPVVSAVTGKVFTVANQANKIVQDAIKKASPFLPGPLEQFAARIGKFTKGLADKARKLFLFVNLTLRPAVNRAFIFLGTQVMPLVNQAIMESLKLQQRLVNQIQGLALSGRIYLEDIERRIEAMILAIKNTAQGGIDTALGTIGGALQTAVATAEQVGTAVADGVAGGVQSVEQAGERAADSAVGSARKELGLPAAKPDLVGGAKKLAGQIGRSALSFASGVAETAVGIGKGVVDAHSRFSQKAIPHDGELTGPFFPQTASERAAGGGHFDAEERHSKYDEASRRSMLKRGAQIFVNGIDTTLEDHYAAAQRLANELGRPVVGIYNATGGKGTDLLQCASDKLFDRTDNPAIKTLVGILNEQGHKPGKKPQTNIYAHSQGSLIVSEALRQAGNAGANLQQYEVTTFGNAAYTFPKGPKYHHYVHDDDLVSANAGTSSRISYLMNQTRIGRWLSEKMLGPMSDAQKDTIVLHHGGAMIEPHGINARKDDGTADGPEQKRDYIGHLHQFQTEEKKSAARGPRSKAIETSVSFSMARGVGQMVSDGVASSFGKLDTVARTVAPMLPGNVATSLWNGISSRLTSFGHSVYSAGARLGHSQDTYYQGRTETQRGASLVQRLGTGPAPDHDPAQVKAKLDSSGEPGFAPDSMLREQLSPFLGFDPGGVRMHTGPASAQMASNLSAKAFTIGQDVYFGEGSFNPSSLAGKALIGHELTHVGQQSGMAGPLRGYSPVGSAGDSMEAEAQTVATRIMENVGNAAGFHVQHFHKVYEAAEGVGREDQRRLDRIGELAIAQAQVRLGNHQGTIEEVFVNIELDLGTISDQDAARLWADAIVAAVRQAKIVPLPTVPAPRRIQRDDKTPAQDTRPRRLPNDIEAAIQSDADIVLKEYRAWSTDWNVIQGIFDKWQALDHDTTGKYHSPTLVMDTFLAQVRQRNWDKGIISTQNVWLLDEILRSKPEYASYLKPTKVFGNWKPDEVADSAASYVGRHVLVGILGIIKALGGALMGLGQAALWLQWHSFMSPLGKWNRWTAVKGLKGLQKVSSYDLSDLINILESDNPPKMDEYVGTKFDETGKIIVDLFDVPPDEKKAMLADFGFGAKWGQIPANLMMLGAGSGGLTSKGAQYLLKTLMLVQTVKGIDDAMKAMDQRVQEMREKAAKENPPREITWWEIVSDGEMLRQFTTIIVSAIALGTNMSEADQKAKGLLELLKKAGYMADWSMLAPLFKKAWDDYHEGADTEDAKAKRKDKLEQDAVDIINQIINIGNSAKSRHEEHQQQEKLKQQQAEQDRLGKAYESNKREEAAKAAAAAAKDAPPAKPPEPAEVPKYNVDAEKQRQIEEAYRQKAQEEGGIDEATKKKQIDEAWAERNRKASMPGEKGAPLGPPEEHAPAAAHGHEETPPGLKQESIAQKEVIAAGVAKGNEPAKPGAVAAARKIIESEGGWKAKLRKAVSGKGEFASEAKTMVDQAAVAKDQADAIKAANDERAAKKEPPVTVEEAEKIKGDVAEKALNKEVGKIGDVFDEARAQIINEAAESIRKAHPELDALIGTERKGKAHRAGFFEVGTPGFTSDRDITARPREEHIQALAKFDEMAAKASTPEEKAQIMQQKAQRVSELVKASGDVVKLMNEELAKRTGGVPDKTLDTNMYSWTGAEVKFELPSSEMAGVNRATDVASIAEHMRQMSPAEWQAFKEATAQQLEGWGQTGSGKAMREELFGKKSRSGKRTYAEGQFALAEKINADLDRRINAELAKSGGKATDAAAMMDARAKVAGSLNTELVSALSAKPPDFAKIASLQAQIKMMEPGAYASQAGIKDIVDTQQPMSRAAEDVFKAREELDKAKAAGKPQAEIDALNQKVKDAEANVQKQVFAGDRLDIREMAQSAASTLAQFEEHGPSKHAPTDEVEAFTALKDAFKYTSRIAYLEYLATGKTVAVPEVANYARPKQGDYQVVGQWAKETGRISDPAQAKGRFTELATQYAQERLDWCRNAVIDLRLEALARDRAAARGEAPAQPQPSTPPPAGVQPAPPEPSAPPPSAGPIVEVPSPKQDDPVRSKPILQPHKDKKDDDDQP